MELTKEPINNIKWVDAQTLNPNSYNPNSVLTPEMRLLKHSLMYQGWIQPILIGIDNVIIDGFHRYSLAIKDPDIIQKYKYQVPVIIFDMPAPERMLLTVRIKIFKSLGA